LQARSDLAKLKAEFELTKTELLKLLAEQQKKLDDAYRAIDGLKVVYEASKPLVENIYLLLPVLEEAREEKDRAEALRRLNLIESKWRRHWQLGRRQRFYNNVERDEAIF